MEQLFDLLSQLKIEDVILISFWGFAGAISFYFSIGNARIWTSISMGFFLLFLSQAYLLNPYAVSYFRMSALHTIIGTLAILLISHGFMEYYVFCKTFEITGKKMTVYVTILLVILSSTFFLYYNPAPSPNSLRNFKIVENSIWVFLSLINIELIRKIYLSIKDSEISRGFLAFSIVFLCLFLWKGSELYLQVYQWDKDWQDIIAVMDESTDIHLYPFRVNLAQSVTTYAGYLSSISVGGTFAYMYRLLK